MNERVWKGTAYEVKIAPVGQAVAGTTTIIAAESGLVPIIFSICLRSSANGTLKFTATGGADLSPVVLLAAAPLTYDNVPIVKGVVSVGIDLVTVTNPAAGWVAYIMVPANVA